MTKQIIAIDGACRDNGKPHCVSAGGIYKVHYATSGHIRVTSHSTMSGFEHGSTNQRGELLALHLALESLVDTTIETMIVTDSEYIYNSMSKGWPERWSKNGWLKADGGAVQNQDWWEKIWPLYQSAAAPIEFYHIKGHVMSFGKVTAANLFNKDTTGQLLHDAVLQKWLVWYAESKNREKVRAIVDKVSSETMGYIYEDEILQRFVCLNLVADAVATACVEKAKALQP